MQGRTIRVNSDGSASDLESNEGVVVDGNEREREEDISSGLNPGSSTSRPILPTNSPLLPLRTHLLDSVTSGADAHARDPRTAYVRVVQRAERVRINVRRDHLERPVYKIDDLVTIRLQREQSHAFHEGRMYGKVIGVPYADQYRIQTEVGILKGTV